MKDQDTQKDLESIRRLVEILEEYKTHLNSEYTSSKTWKGFFDVQDEFKYKFDEQTGKLSKLEKENKLLKIEELLDALTNKNNSAQKRLTDFVTKFDEHKQSLESRRIDATDPFILHMIKRKLFEIIPSDYLPKSWRVHGAEATHKISGEISARNKK